MSSVIYMVEDIGEGKVRVVINTDGEVDIFDKFKERAEAMRFLGYIVAKVCEDLGGPMTAEEIDAIE